MFIFHILGTATCEFEPENENVYGHFHVVILALFVHTLKVCLLFVVIVFRANKQRLRVSCCITTTARSWRASVYQL